MQIKTPTEFLTFNDGLCDVYTMSGNKLGDKVATLAYGIRTVSMKRFYEARAATAKIDQMIQVPMQDWITTAHRVVISGVQYKIEQSQYLKQTNPPATVLSLNRIGQVPAPMQN